MARVTENALTILRVLDEAKATAENPLTCGEIASRAGFSQAAFDNADAYLSEAGYVTGTQGGVEAECWPTAAGIEFLELSLAMRVPLSLDAERLLSLVVTSARFPKDAAERHTLIEALQFDDQRYEEACRALTGQGYITVPFISQVSYANIRATPEGRQAVQNGFMRPNAGGTQITFNQQGWNVQGNVYNAGRDINFAAVQSRGAFIDALEKVKQELASAIDANVIDEEVASDAEHQLTRAIEQAKKPEPNKQTITERIEGAAKLLQGVAAAAGMIEALSKAAEVVPHLFS